MVTQNKLSKKISFFIVLDANIVSKMHCSVGYSWWEHACQQQGTKRTGLRWAVPGISGLCDSHPNSGVAALKGALDQGTQQTACAQMLKLGELEEGEHVVSAGTLQSRQRKPASLYRVKSQVTKGLGVGY